MDNIELITQLRNSRSCDEICDAAAEALEVAQANARTDEILLSAAQDDAARAVAERDTAQAAEAPGTSHIHSETS